jgi:WD40 repeat protein
VATGRHLRRLDGHDQSVFTVVFSPNGKQLASCGWDDQTIRLWEVATGKRLTQFPGQAKVSRLGFSPDGRFLVSTGWGDAVRVWDCAWGKGSSNQPHPPA